MQRMREFKDQYSQKMFNEIDIRRIKDSASIKDVMEDFGFTLRKDG